MQKPECIKPLARSLGSRTRIEAHFTCTSSANEDTVSPNMEIRDAFVTSGDGKNDDTDYIIKIIIKTGDHASTSQQNFGSLEGSSSMELSAVAAQIIVNLLHLYISGVSDFLRCHQRISILKWYFSLLQWSCQHMPTYVALKHFAPKPSVKRFLKCLAWIGQSLAGHQRGNRLSYTVWSPAGSAISRDKCNTASARRSNISNTMCILQIPILYLIPLRCPSHQPKRLAQHWHGDLRIFQGLLIRDGLQDLKSVEWLENGETAVAKVEETFIRDWRHQTCLHAVQDFNYKMHWLETVIIITNI